MTMYGQVNSFQKNRNVKIASVAIAPPDTGITMFQRIRSRPQPSIFAASSSSDGMPRKNWRSKKTPKPPASGGTISAVKLFSQSKRQTVTQLGISQIAGGTI